MGSFLYFGFGSNLLKERLQLLNPSAVFKTIAKLQDYQLKFDQEEGCDVNKLSWKGCAATVVPCPGSEVWGCLWELQLSDEGNLDMQEGVEVGMYKRIYVTVTDEAGTEYQCRTYQLLKTGKQMPKPSPQYLDIILRGAKQNNLPSYYLDFLKQFSHNGNTAKVAVYDEILKILAENEK